MVGEADRVRRDRRERHWRGRHELDTLAPRKAGCTATSLWAVKAILVCGPRPVWPGVRRAGLPKGWARRWRRASGAAGAALI